MVPHVLGWFPMFAAWVMIVNALETARRDLEDVSDTKIPEWVYGAVRCVCNKRTHTKAHARLFVRRSGAQS